MRRDELSSDAREPGGHDPAYPGGDTDGRPRAGRAVRAQVQELRAQVKFLEEEVGLLRRRLTNAPRQVTILEEKLLETREQLDARDGPEPEARRRPPRRAREDRGARRTRSRSCRSRPHRSACSSRCNDDGSIDVFTAGRKMRVAARARYRRTGVPGRRPGDPERVAERRRGPRARPRGRGREGQGPARRRPGGRGGRGATRSTSPTWRASCCRARLRAGDNVLFDARVGRGAPSCCRRRRSRSSSSRRSPTSATRTSAGSRGRSRRSATPSSCRSSTRSCSTSTSSSRRRACCSTALPGCGKTLIAKAVAKSLAEKVAERTGRDDARSYFLNVKGPELLNKYVGETERQIREIFQRAKERSEEGLPVIVFFDEMDSIFRTRGTGISSDVESTIVPQLLSRARRRRDAEERDRDRRLEPRGPDRPGDPAPRPPRREDQDRASRASSRPPTS